MLTDLIAAHADDATAILHAQGHATIWPTLDGRGLDLPTLAALGLVLHGQPVSAPALGIVQLTFVLLVADGDDGPALHQLPPALSLALAQLPQDQVAAMAEAWAGAAPAAFQRWDLRELRAFLAELSAFAASALAQGQQLLLWTCP